MPKVNANIVRQQPVEEKNHSKSIGILSHHITFDITNKYSKWNKTLYHYIMKK